MPSRAFDYLLEVIARQDHNSKVAILSDSVSSYVIMTNLKNFNCAGLDTIGLPDCYFRGLPKSRENLCYVMFGTRGEHVNLLSIILTDTPAEARALAAI